MVRVGITLCEIMWPWMDGSIVFNGILSMQIVASCLLQLRISIRTYTCIHCHTPSDKQSSNRRSAVSFSTCRLSFCDKGLQAVWLSANQNSVLFIFSRNIDTKQMIRECVYTDSHLTCFQRSKFDHGITICTKPNTVMWCNSLTHHNTDNSIYLK